MSSTVPPALGEPPLKTPTQPARWPAPVSVVMVVVALLLISFLISVWWLDRPSRASEWVLKAPVSPSGLLPLPTPIARPTGAYQGLCDGSELFCLSTESGRPAETLRQLAATLSVESTRRYQIHLTITPLEEDPTPVGEATSPQPLPAATPP